MRQTNLPSGKGRHKFDPRQTFHAPAAPDAVMCIGDGTSLYVGSFDGADWHLHATAAFIAGISGNFHLGLSDGQRLSCRAAVIPAGVNHALEAGGDPVAVFYLGPHVATVPNLARLGRTWDVHGRILAGRDAEIASLREVYENRRSLDFAGDTLTALVHFVRGDAPPVIDVRLLRVVKWLAANPDNPTGLALLAREEGLSGSHLMHLFARDIGIPFRRFRIWNRLRAATRVVLSGHSLTEAALTAGFTDSAHYARSYRQNFGVTPSYIFRKVARVGRFLPT
jgi:AraC-like DNA-binding protein